MRARRSENAPSSLTSPGPARTAAAGIPTGPATAATGWTAITYVDDPMVMPSRYEYSYDWSTDGYVSLKATITAWGFYIRRDIRDVYWEHDTIEFDAYAIDNGGGWAQIERITEQFSDADASIPNGGMFDMPGTNWDLTFGETTHIAYNYSAYKGGIYGSEAATYGNFIFAFNTGGDGVSIFLDNIKFTGVPEPATIGLLGLGGLALLRRKR